MDGLLLFVILMFFVHGIPAQVIAIERDRKAGEDTQQMASRSGVEPTPPAVNCSTAEPSQRPLSQTPQMSVQHFDGERVLITCSLPGSVKDDTKCNLYFGEASRSTITTTVWKESSSKNKQRFCRFSVPVDDFLRYLHFVQQKDASCDYSLGSEANSLSPRSDRYNLKDIVEKESPKATTKSAATMNTESSPTTSNASTPTTSANSSSDIVEKESPKTNTKSAATESSPTTPNASTPTTSVSSSSVAANLSPVTNVTSAVKITKRVTTGDSTTESSFSHPSTSTASTSVNSPSESHKTNPTVTFTTVKGLTFSRAHASTHTSAYTEGQTQQPGNKTNPIQKKSEAPLWKLSAAVTGFGVTVGVMLLVLGLLRSKRRTERYSQKWTKNSTTGDVIWMRKNKHGGMLSAGNNGASGVITSVPGEEKLNWKETKNEDSDIYHIYATIGEEPAAPDSQDMIYSTLQAH